jgi:cellulose synthase/poly-beta-1,6-N-acetylglucosamine synthase-like glycosyltransferase
MVLAISIISLLLTVFYIILIRYYRKGWDAIVITQPKELVLTQVSVIIPARNEAQNIGHCLEALYQQNYFKLGYEVIVVDDHSTDNTAEVVKNFATEKSWESLHVLELKNIPNKRYKKAAITEAIKQATGEIIITTDADCTMGQEWLTEIVKFFDHHEAALVSGAVVFDWEERRYNSFKNFFLKIQQLEFAGLVGIGGAALQLKFPNMCNGANMAYRKEIFDEVGGYMGNDNILSGDDEFLMHKVFSKYPNDVFFLKNEKTVVKTPPTFTLKDFIGQRMRWVSKSTKYSDKRITTVLTLAYLFNFSMLLNFILGFINPIYFGILAGQLLAKVAIELWLYTSVMQYFNLKHLLKLILLAQPFHILYVLLIGVLGNFGSYNWKGRTQ